jgi:hypothetical protein
MFKSLSLSAVDDSTRSLSSSAADDSISSGDSVSKKVVSFGLILVREYERVVGDNPAVSAGPPMSIGWEFVQRKAVPLDVYEKRKRPRTSDLRMGNFTRKSILREAFGVSCEEIIAAENIVRKIQKQRRQTRQRGETATAIECAVESARRKMQRFKRTKGILPIQQ